LRNPILLKFGRPIGAIPLISIATWEISSPE
jgi:hypothetical protein